MAKADSAHKTRMPQIATELHSVIQALRLVYSACVMTELALQGQNADRDREISMTLRHAVGDGVSREADRLTEIAARL